MKFRNIIICLTFVSIILACNKQRNPDDILDKARQIIRQHAVATSTLPQTSALSPWRVHNTGFDLSCPVDIDQNKEIQVSFTHDVGGGKTRLDLNLVEQGIGKHQVHQFEISGKVFSWDAAIVCAGTVHVGWIEGGQKIVLLSWDPNSATNNSQPITVYQQKWGLRMLALGWHAKMQRLLFAWQDISDSGVHLMRLAHRVVGEPFMPQRAFTFDPWEKSSPAFHHQGDKLVLALDTGQRFGMLSHAGTHAVALAYFDDHAQVTSYYYLATKSSAVQIILSPDGEVYFRGEGNQYFSLATGKLDDLLAETAQTE